jgi:hypothetical protein
LRFHLLTINILSTSLILVVLEKQIVVEDIKLTRPLENLKKNVKVQFEGLLKSMK